MKECLARNKASAGHHMEQNSESGEDGNEVCGDGRAGLRRQILGEQAIGEASSNEKEESLACKKP